jgi:hypothetical protein
LLGDVLHCSPVARAARPGVSCGLAPLDWLAACSADRMAPRCKVQRQADVCGWLKVTTSSHGVALRVCSCCKLCYQYGQE